MQLKENVQPQNLIDALDETKGTIIIKNIEGNRLNVKSQFCQYIFISILLEPELLKECWVECEFEEDMNILSTYMIEDGSIRKLTE